MQWAEGGREQCPQAEVRHCSVENPAHVLACPPSLARLLLLKGTLPGLVRLWLGVEVPNVSSWFLQFVFQAFTPPLPGNEGLKLKAIIGYNGNGRRNMVWNPDTGLVRVRIFLGMFSPPRPSVGQPNQTNPNRLPPWIMETLRFI